MGYEMLSLNDYLSLRRLDLRKPEEINPEIERRIRDYHTQSLARFERLKKIFDQYQWEEC